MKIKFRAFTLLEVIIAMILTAGLLAYMLGVYLEAERASAWWRSQEEKLLPQRFMQKRLEDVFRNLLLPDQKDTFFFTVDSLPGLFAPGTPSLVFSYNNGIVNDSHLSEDVLARLYLDAKGQLTLLTWPERSSWNPPLLPPFHREVLLSDLGGFRLSFIAPPDNEGGDAIGPVYEWSKERKELPIVIKMILQEKNGAEEEYLFPVPQTLSLVEVK